MRAYRLLLPGDRLLRVVEIATKATGVALLLVSLAFYVVRLMKVDGW